MSFRFWLEDHQGWVGVAISIILIGALWLAADPHFPAEQVSGQVLRPVVVPGRKTASNGIEVRVDGRIVAVRAPLHYACDAGDRIALSKLGVRRGYRYGLANVPRPCTRFP